MKSKPRTVFKGTEYKKFYKPKETKTFNPEIPKALKAQSVWSLIKKFLRIMKS